MKWDDRIHQSVCFFLISDLLRQHKRLEKKRKTEKERHGIDLCKGPQVWDCITELLSTSSMDTQTKRFTSHLGCCSILQNQHRRWSLLHAVFMHMLCTTLHLPTARFYIFNVLFLLIGRAFHLWTRPTWYEEFDYDGIKPTNNFLEPKVVL